ncbi:hypothetical protein [Facilibium subflavum]|uniref:hypothetical protein n=1 Tax=Facilibium subflavum TaxID=2219058 RepID=UPI000E65BE03|nr:hypothetical protein [Facilibium subflavum]
MIKKNITFLSLCVLSSLSYAHCELGQTSCSRFSLSPTIGYYKYAEPGYMKITGLSVGLQFDYQYIQKNNLVLQIQSQLGFVNGKYDGSLLNSQPYSNSNDDSYIFSVAPSVGYRFSFSNNAMQLIPYAGLGYRFLNNDTSDTSAGYQRLSNYFYLPVGFQFEQQLKRWQWQLNAEFDYLIYGNQYSGIDGGVNNPQHHGWGANASLLFGHQVDSVGWYVGPYIKYWRIQQSDTASGNTSSWVEPENYTVDAGVMFKFVF